MGFSSLIQKLIFITLDASILIASERQKKKLFSRDIYSEHFIILLEASWTGRECSSSGQNYERQRFATYYNKLEGKKGEMKRQHFYEVITPSGNLRSNGCLEAEGWRCS